MAIKRKKTLAELMQERTQQSTDTSAYTTKPMPRATSNITTGNTNNDTWNRVLNRANQIMNNTSVRNFQITNPNSNPMSLYIGMNKGAERDKKYQEEMKKQALERERNTLAKFAEKSNKKMKEGSLLEKTDAVVSTAVLGLGQGGASAVGNTTGAIYNIVEGIANKAGIKTEKKKDMRANFYPMSSKDYTNMIKQNEAVMSEYGSNLKNGLGTVNTVSNIIGNMLVSAGTGGDKASRIASAVTSGSQGYMQALNEEQDNKLKAGITGGLKGIITYNLEGLTGGNFMGKGSLDDFATKAISKMSKKEITKKAMSKLYEVFGENVEENAENALGHIVDVALGNEKVPTIDQLIKETLETTKDTTLTTAILSLFGLGGNTYNDVKLYEMKQDQIKNSGLDEKTQERLDNVSQKYDLSPEDLQKLIDNTKNGFYEENQATTIENKPISEQSQQVISNESKIAENGMSQETKGNDKYAIKIPNSNYKFVRSGDEKIDNFRQDVSQNWNNSKDTQKLVSTIETIMKDKGVAVRLDANLKDADGNIANGKYENGVITINPNSKRAFEYIATHELTHAIGTKQMLDMVQRYRQDNNEFNSKVETLLKNYNATELTEEALADVSAQLFGTQEFINNVKNTNPNLFQKIYNEIKYLWHQFRGYKNQNQFIEDLYNKWTQAYNSDKKLNDTTNYYIEPVAKFDETEYNNVIEEKLGKKEYAILRNIINSDSNIKPGINYVEVTNGRYTIYYKGFDDFKVMSRKVDVDAGRINKRNDTTGRKARYSKTFEQSIGNEGTTTSNDEISVFNTSGTRERSRSNTSSSTNIENGIKLPTQESENNSGSFNLQKLEERVSGDKLLDTQDFIEEIKSVGADVDDNGYVTVYHQTTSENANKIKQSGKMSAKEDGIFFSTSENAQQSEGRGTDKIKFKIPAELLQLDDIFDDNADVKIPLKNRNETIDVSQYIIKENDIEQENIKDNKGRTLSKEQQEYFKDSKVRDEEGHLIEVYHGTNSDFTIFKNPEKNSYDYKSGETFKGTSISFFTDSIEVANTYIDSEIAPNKNPMRTYLNIKNPLIIDAQYQNSRYLPEFVTGGMPSNINRIVEEAYKSGKYDGVILKNISDLGAYGEYDLTDGNQYSNVYITFNSNQIKNVDNTNPTDNPDIRYLKENTEWQEYLEEHFKTEGTRTTKEQVGLPRAKEIPQNDNMQQKNVKNGLPQKRNITDEVYREDIAEGKTRKHYKSVFESEQVGEQGKEAAKQLYQTDTYTPVSNLETITDANDYIGRVGLDNAYIGFTNKINSNEKIRLEDIALGERLIQIYSENGDFDKVNELIQDVAILGTELGQQVQAFSLIKKASPEGQLQYLQKLLNRTNIKEDTNIKITKDMTEKILKSKDAKELEDNMSKVAIEIANQIPLKGGDKIRAWRYLSMLGNPKTHIKNLGANLFMNITQNAKNKIAGGIESVVSIFNPNMERTKTLRFANKEQRSFAKQDAEEMADLIDAGGKYDVKNIIQQNKRQFDNKTLNAIADFNSKALDWEDKIFLKKAYQQAMQGYMAANNLKASDMTGQTLEKARQYASLQAQQATFHEFNAVANLISQLENKNKIAGFVTSSVLPFKKTPMNIAKAGFEYSAVGLGKSLTYDIAQTATKTKKYKQQLAEGKITQEQYNAETSKMLNKTIDNMAKGLTGSSIALIGFFLASKGLLKAGNDDEGDEFEEKTGKQEYSIQFGDNTYTLDWISPSAIPLFTGATIYQLATGDGEDKETAINSALTGFSKAFEPMTEMSMLQGLASAIASYEEGSSGKFFDLGASMVTSYAGQFLPTAMGQLARTIDPYERDTSSTKKGIEGKADKFIRQSMNKLPGVSKRLPIKKDVWGEEVKRADNLAVRYAENALLPWSRKEITQDRTDKELLSVFDKTGENVLPGTPSKDLTINGEKYRLTTEEYNKAKSDFGKTSKKIFDNLVNTPEYRDLTAEGKAKAIKDVYSYAKEKIKVDYAKKQGKEIETSTMYDTVSELQKQKGDISAYFEFKGKIDDLDRSNGEDKIKQKEKLEYLNNMTTDKKTKRIIYEDTFGSNDELYGNLKVLTGNRISIEDYLNYKTTEIKGTDDPYSNVKGATIKGSKKKSLQNFLENSNFSGIEMLYIYGTQNSFNDSQRAQFQNYVTSLNLNPEEEYEIYKKLNSIEELDDGRIRWK